MEEAKLIIAIIALVVSIASFMLAQYAAVKARRSEDINHLLGEKEGVAYAALKLLRDGLPQGEKHRKLIIAALMQACVFEGSDRARALLYRVIELNRKAYQGEFTVALKTITDTFASMDAYKFPTEILDLSRGRRRIAAVHEIVDGKRGITPP